MTREPTDWTAIQEQFRRWKKFRRFVCHGHFSQTTRDNLGIRHPKRCGCGRPFEEPERRWRL